MATSLADNLNINKNSDEETIAQYYYSDKIKAIFNKYIYIIE